MKARDSYECVATMSLLPTVLGWRVLQLYGNHELMTVMSPQEKYVHYQDFEEYGGRQAMWDWFQKGDGFNHIASTFLGFAVLRSGPESATNTLFVHGGVQPTWLSAQRWASPQSPAAMNQGIAALMRDKRTRMSLYDEDAFVWTRDFENGEEGDLCGDYIDWILTYFDVARVIVGHSPQEDRRARVRCGGKVILADTMISRWMWIPDFQRVPRGAHADQSNPTAYIMRLKDGELSSLVEYHTDQLSGTADTDRRLPTTPAEASYEAKVRAMPAKEDGVRSRATPYPNELRADPDTLPKTQRTRWEFGQTARQALVADALAAMVRPVEAH